MNKRHVEVQPLSNVVSKEVNWLAPPYIPRGKVTLLQGDPESGKTYLSLALAAAVTTGQHAAFMNSEIPVEGSERSICVPETVIGFTAEDGLNDTVKPRFVKQRGDEARFLAVQGVVREEGGKRHYGHFNLSCVDELEDMLATYKPGLVIFDPIQAFLGAKVDMHRANEVRPLFSGLMQLAEEHDTAFLMLGHLNKSSQQRAQYRGMGSIDMPAAARSILFAGRDPDHPGEDGRFVVVHTKSSLGRKGPSLKYWITDSGLTITGACDCTAEQLLAPVEPTPQQQPQRPRDTAIKFVRVQLADGPMTSKELAAAAEREGINPHTLQRAKHELGVTCGPMGLQGPWCCQLPGSAGPLPIEQ